MMSEEVAVQVVFPMLQIQRFVRTSRTCTIHFLIEELIRMDELLSSCIDVSEPWVFDEKGVWIDAHQSLEAFKELDWIQLFVC